jgi:hypothetical protein
MHARIPPFTVMLIVPSSTQSCRFCKRERKASLCLSVSPSVSLGMQFQQVQQALLQRLVSKQCKVDCCVLSSQTCLRPPDVSRASRDLNTCPMLENMPRHACPTLARTPFHFGIGARAQHFSCGRLLLLRCRPCRCGRTASSCQRQRIKC